MVDLLALSAGTGAAIATSVVVSDIPSSAILLGVQATFLLVASFVAMVAAGLYRRSICAIHATELARIGRVALAMAFCSSVVLAPSGIDVALPAGFIAGVVWYVLLFIVRGLMREWIQMRRAAGDFSAAVIVVGREAESALDTADFLAENPVLGFTVSGVICPEPPESRLGDLQWLGPVERLLPAIEDAGARGVVLDSLSMNGRELNETIVALTPTDTHVHVSSGLRGIDRRRISVEPLVDETFLYVAPVALTRWQVMAKRFLDVVIGSAALVALSPALILSAVAVWLYDRGPIVFRQARVGLNGEPFQLLKLRTMSVDAEARLKEVQAGNVRSGPLFKAAGDPRVTPIGRFLRVSSLDEVPQLFNVLAGTMSLVGPRPALPEEVQQFDDELLARQRVKPGVTGLWQVEARDLPSFDLYRRYDLHYVQNWSVGLDIVLIVRTAVVVTLRTLRAVVFSTRRDAVGSLE